MDFLKYVTDEEVLFQMKVFNRCALFGMLIRLQSYDLPPERRQYGYGILTAYLRHYCSWSVYFRESGEEPEINPLIPEQSSRLIGYNTR
jgi:hypothetical protein